MTTQTETKKDPKAELRVLTPVFRVSFPSVFEPKEPMNPGQKPKYTVGMLFKKTNETEKGLWLPDWIKPAVSAALIGKWGADKAKWPKPLHLPFRDGAEKEYDGYGAEIIFATASSVNKPGVVDQNVKPIISRDEFYAGCYARAKIEVYAFEAKDKKTGAVLKKGITLTLLNIQKHSDGEPFSGRSAPEADFDAVPMPAASAGESEDPLADIGA